MGTSDESAARGAELDELLGELRLIGFGKHRLQEFRLKPRTGASPSVGTVGTGASPDNPTKLHIVSR
jgi:hypothetical protein